MEETVNKINVAFFGTSDRSIPILESLNNDPLVNLVLCVTKEDTKVGRNQEIRETEVKKWSLANGIKCITTNNIKYSTEPITEEISYSNIQLGIVADFSFIIPESIFRMPKYKFINIHFSLLPKWRGASPVQFAILHSDETTGITYHLVDKKMDTGEIIYQIGYKMLGTETSGELYDHLFALAAENLPKVIRGYIEGTLTLQTQDDSQASYTLSPSHPNSTFIYKEDARIDWKKSPEEIEKAVRAFHPWPIAWTTLGELQESTFGRKDPDPKRNEKRVKIHEAVVKDNMLKIRRLQVEGSKIIEWDGFVNGYTPKAEMKSEKKTNQKDGN